MYYTAFKMKNKCSAYFKEWTGYVEYLNHGINCDKDNCI